jgi:hypothetical protein
MPPGRRCVSRLPCIGGHVKDLNGSTTDFFSCRGGSEVGSAPELDLKGSFTGGAFKGTLSIDNIVCTINCTEDVLGPIAVEAAAPCNFTPIKDLRPIYQNFKSGLDAAPLVANLTVILISDTA